MSKHKHITDMLPKYSSLLSDLLCYTLRRIWENPGFPRACTASSRCILIAGILTCVVCLLFWNWTFTTPCQQISASKSIFLFINQSYSNCLTEPGYNLQKRRKQGAYSHDRCRCALRKNHPAPAECISSQCNLSVCATDHSPVQNTRRSPTSSKREDQHHSTWSRKVFFFKGGLFLKL